MNNLCSRPGFSHPAPDAAGAHIIKKAVVSQEQAAHFVLFVLYINELVGQINALQQSFSAWLEEDLLPSIERLVRNAVSRMPMSPLAQSRETLPVLKRFAPLLIILVPSLLRLGFLSNNARQEIRYNNEHFQQ